MAWLRNDDVMLKFMERHLSFHQSKHFSFVFQVFVTSHNAEIFLSTMIFHLLSDSMISSGLNSHSSTQFQSI